MFNKAYLDESELKAMTRKIEQQAGNVSLLIENILLLVKSQLNGIMINKEIFDLGDWVNNHFRLYSLQASEKQIEIVSNIASGIMVMSDRNVVSLVIRNLVANAIKFSHRNSTIQVLATELQNHVQLSVVDSGQGMTESQIQSIFSKATSIRSVSGTERETGMGLGLKLCRDYLILMGSDFIVESTPGQGTSISIHLEKA